MVGDGVLNLSGRLVTAQAKFEGKQVSIGAQALFVREEMPMPSGSEGIVVMMADAGDRVATGQNLAMVCGDGRDAEALTKQTALEQRLRWLLEA